MDTTKRWGFTLIEMLTTTAILVIIFGLLTVLFTRATTIHKVVRSGGDAENFGIYLLNTIIYGPGANREEGLIAAPAFSYSDSTTKATELSFTTRTGKTVRYLIADGTLKYGPSGSEVDLKPSWARDRQLDVLPTESGFFYYKDGAGTVPATANGENIYSLRVKLVLKSVFQAEQEKVVLERLVRIRNQIEF